MDIKLVADEIIKGLQEGPYQDISDIGNIIGIVLGKHISKESNGGGYGLDDFDFGVRHGISLSTGEHK